MCIFLVNFCLLRNLLKIQSSPFCNLHQVSPFYSGMKVCVSECMRYYPRLSQVHGSCSILCAVIQSDKQMQALKSNDNLHSHYISTLALSNEGRFSITRSAKHRCKWISVTHKLWSWPVSDSGQSLTEQHDHSAVNACHYLFAGNFLKPEFAWSIWNFPELNI